MFCPNCGSSVGDNSKFCGVCGYKLWASEAPMVPAESSQPAQPVQEAAPAAGEAAPVAAAPVDSTAAQPADQGSSVLHGGQSLFSTPIGETPQEVLPEAISPMQNTAQPDIGAPAQGGFTPASGNVPPLQPQYAQYQQAESYTIPVRRQVKKMHIAVSIVLAVVFGLFAYSAGMSAFTGAVVRMGLSSHSVSEQMRNIEIGDIVIGDLLSREAMQDIVEKNSIRLPEKRVQKATLADIVALSVDTGHEPLTAEQVKKILAKSKAADRLADLVACYEDYILTCRYDDFEDGVGEEIKNIVKKTEASVIEITNLRLADDYEEQLDKILDDNDDALEAVLPDNAIANSAQALSITLAPAALIAYLVLCLVLIALPSLITKRLGLSLMTGGVVFSVIGLGMIASSVVISCLGSFPWLGVSIVKDVLVPVVYNAFGFRTLIGGLIALGAGLVLIAAFIVLRVLAKKKAAKQPANA